MTIKHRKTSRVIGIIFIVFTFLYLVFAIPIYMGGQEEVTATVTRVYKTHGHNINNGKRREYYSCVWQDLNGNEVAETKLYNSKHYKEGDQLTVMVDRKTHTKLYSSFIPSFVVSAVFFMIGVWLLFITRKRYIKTHL